MGAKVTDIITDPNKKKLRSNIQKNIAFYRKKMNLRQKDLADLLGVGSTTVSGWERCTSVPDFDMLLLVCDVLGVSFLDMLDVDEIFPSDSLSVSGIERDIVLSYRHADDIEKAMVLRALGLD